MTAESKPLTKGGADGWGRTGSARAKEWCRDAQERGRLLAWEWTEHNLSRGRIFWKSDFFGFADLVMVRSGSLPTSMMNRMPELVAVQVTGGPSNSGDGPKRVKKIKAEPKAAAWLATGSRIEVWDYRWRKKGGKYVTVERVVIPVTQTNRP